MLFTNAVRNFFKQIFSKDGCLDEEDVKIRNQIRKAVEAERLQAYLERIVQRIDELERRFAWTGEGMSTDEISGETGDYRIYQARDRLSRLQEEAKSVKNRVSYLKFQVYCQN